jgi:hypothetical protein
VQKRMICRGGVILVYVRMIVYVCASAKYSKIIAEKFTVIKRLICNLKE